MAVYFTTEQLTEIQNWLIDNGIDCEIESTAINDTDEIPANTADGTGKHFTISQLKADLKSNVAFSVDTTNNRKYLLKMFGETVANFTVPVDKFIKSVSYNESTRKLVFVFYKADETEETVYVDISSLVDVYTAGDGLNLSSGSFAIKLKSGESRLKVDSNGLYLNFDHTHDDRYYTETEMDTKLNLKANQSTTYTKTEVDTKIASAGVDIPLFIQDGQLYCRYKTTTETES